MPHIMFLTELIDSHEYKSYFEQIQHVGSSYEFLIIVYGRF